MIPTQASEFDRLHDRPANGEDELRYATTVIVADCLRRPESYQLFQLIEPEDFPSWADQELWRALQATLDRNDGLGEFSVLEAILRSNWPDEAGPLIERLAGHLSVYLWPYWREHDFAVMKRNGIRRRVRSKAMDIVDLCENRGPIGDVRDLLEDCLDLVNGGPSDGE